MLERRRGSLFRYINGAIWLAMSGVLPLAVCDVCRILCSIRTSEQSSTDPAFGGLGFPVFATGVICAFLLGGILLGILQGFVGFVVGRSIDLRDPDRGKLPFVAAIHFAFATAIIGSLVILFFVRRGYVVRQSRAYLSLIVLVGVVSGSTHVFKRFRAKFRVEQWGRMHAHTLSVSFLVAAFFFSCLAWPPTPLHSYQKWLLSAFVITMSQLAVYWQYVYWRPRYPKMGTIFHNTSVIGAVTLVVAIAAFFGTSLIQHNLLRSEFWDAGLLSEWLFDRLGPWINSG